MIDEMTHDGNYQTKNLPDQAALQRCVEEIVNRTPVIDIHTHLYPAQFGQMNLYGIDELLTYHYLIAELFRSSDVRPDVFRTLGKKEKADLIWQALFVENTPLSEAATGVITVLSALGLDANARDLDEIRRFFADVKNPAAHVERILKISNVSGVVMTNDPFDINETNVWCSELDLDRKFYAALRMDRILNDWENTSARLAAENYRVGINPDGRTCAETRCFLDAWIARIKPLYMAVSLPDDFDYFADDVRNKLIREVVLPAAKEHQLPFAVMIGVRRNVNPALREAGDGVGRADVRALEKMCAENEDVRFLATFLSRENQHELCVSARKFANLMPFGCWWFLNNPSIVEEITNERLELLGTSFIPQHSDARVLEQLIYKWKHSRRVIAASLAQSYERLRMAGRAIGEREIERDVRRLFAGNFQNWVKMPAVKAADQNNG